MFQPPTLNNQPPEWEKIQTQKVMSTQIQKLEQLHQLVNNEVNRPKLISFIKNNVPKETYLDGTPFNDSYMDIKEHLENNDNVFGITNKTERYFFTDCIFNNDFEAFLNEENEENSTESDWERYTQNILNVINK
jgi:hypothetical protein